MEQLAKNLADNQTVASALKQAVATDFVFRSDKRPRSCSISTLRSLAADNELTEEQMQRWQHFKTYMSQQGWTVADLVGMSGELCTKRYPLAHGYTEEQEAVTPAMLEDWVNKYYGTDNGIHTLIKLVSKFTLPSQPLCKNPRFREMIEQELHETTAK